MSSKITNCKSCGNQITKSTKFCPNCGTKNKKPIYKKWWFWVIVAILIIAISSSGSSSDNDVTTNNHAQAEGFAVSATDNSANTENTTNLAPVTENTSPEIGKDNGIEVSEKTEYYVGDILEDGTTRIVFMSSGDYTEENEFMQPSEGNKYIFLQFSFENLSDDSDTSISSYSFECFADGYATEMYYGGEEDLSATLSAGRTTTGYIYFEVPVDANSIEVEYETNFITNDKIKFIFEGNKDSGYIQKLNTQPTEDAYSVGAKVESSNLIITYISCEEYVSDNMFMVPADGYRYISCEFEFENSGSSDEHISSYDFDCYADGLSCNAIYIRDDNLSATISTGRKAKGTVTFEVPIEATVIEVEYLSNYWTSNRVVFTAN